MHVQLDLGGSRRDVEIVVHHPDATVADLLDAVDASGHGSGIAVDGRIVPARQRLDRAGIAPGATLRPVSGAGPVQGEPDGRGEDGCGREPVVVLRSIGGLDAGRTWPLGPGIHRLGRTGSGPRPAGGPSPGVALDDLTVSTHHAAIVVGPDGSVRVADLGSRNGTWIGDRAIGTVPTPLAPGERVRCGASILALDGARAGSAPAGREGAGPPVRRSGTRPLHRPPRPGSPPERDAIEPPAAPTAATGTSPIGIVSVVVPIVLGLVMVRVLHSWTYALFMLLSPVLLIGTAIEQRRWGRRARHRDAVDFRRRLADLAGALDVARQEAAGRQWARLPGVAAATARAATASAHLWERRPHHADAFVAAAGLGAVPWIPPVSGDRRSWAPDVTEAVDARSTLVDAPVELDLSPGQVIGVAGERAAALAVVRAVLVQLATQHGPADLVVAVCTDDTGAADWDWVKWLPHLMATAAAVGMPAVALGDDAADGLVSALADARHAAGSASSSQTGDDGADGQPLLVVLIDRGAGADAIAGPARRLLRGGLGPLSAIVVAEDPDQLPVATSEIVALDAPSGLATVQRLDPPAIVEGVHPGGVSLAVAERAARHLAAFTDPEAPAGADLPTSVALPPLLGLDPPSPLALQARWAAAGTDPPPVAVLGVAADGPVTVDVSRDGPHALIAGTTGSGKSELLRTLVASLAAGSSPRHLGFVLIDFKGGSAFAECARLPHTVGFVTDLDDHLAARALRCLEAELRHREQRLADAGVTDLQQHRRSAPDDEPLPRLVVVIDEFATLATELPDFVDALVGIAQRGRSLGVHLVLATQRPAGAVSANIQANTDLRIALRVQTPEESQDVIGTAAAARLPRSAQGRAVVRLGNSGLVTMQTAWAGGSTASGRHAVDTRPFTAAPVASSPSRPAVTAGGDQPAHDESALAALVRAAREAYAASGHGPLRSPWPPPLPTAVAPAALTAASEGDDVAADVVLLGLADRPDEQRQEAVGWRPSAGGLLVVGVGGSGTTTTAQTAVLGLAERFDPADLHVYVLDHGSGDHEPLARVPHVGAVVRSGDAERQRRTLRMVADELDRRRRGAVRRERGPRVVLVVDGLSGFRAELGDDPDGWLDLLARVVADGPAVGISSIVTADRAGAVPPAIGALLTQRIVLRLGDRNEHGAFGIPPSSVPDLPPGRGYLPDGPTLVQVAREPDLRATVEAICARHRWVEPGAAPAPIAVLPDAFDLTTVRRVCPPRLDRHPWRLPVAVAEDDLGPAALVLHEADHALIAGPARSGRTTALRTIAAAARASRAPIHLVAVGGPRSALLAEPDLDRCLDPGAVDAGTVRALAEHPAPVLVLVDDADRTDDGGPLADLVALARSDLHLIAAGRAEPLRQTFTHWTRGVRASRTGVLLQPDVDLDGDLLGCRLPRRAPVPLVRGRGWLVQDGEVRLVQVARPGRPTVTD